MAKAGNRIIFSLECQTCKRRNYSTTKNKRTTPEKVKLKKYCAFCRSHSEHKETK
jgi:large subunit ribosomal protein L33